MKNYSIIALTILCILSTTACAKTKKNKETIDNTELKVVDDSIQKGRPKIQVVFLLDATGSMSGLISTAKDKIWSIAGSLSQTEPAPYIEIGMLFYRDRGDEFVTKILQLSTDIDNLYEQLMAIQATGGGDMPESVNQALYESVTKMQWDDNPNTYKAIFLVGDCPPHMDYSDDVKYPESCAEAKKRNIIINTIQMGSEPSTIPIWKKIASSTMGEYIQTDMSVNNISVATPYDNDINDKQYELDNTRIYYGKSAEMAVQKKTQSEKMKSGDASVNARRSEYNLSKAGKSSYYGVNELINDVSNGKKISDIKPEELPEELKKMPIKELQEYVTGMIEKRKTLEKEIATLNKNRQEYIDKELVKIDKEVIKESFDDVVFDAIQSQAESKNIKIEGKAKR